MADFPLTPDFPVTRKKRYKTLKTKFENGTVQRRKKWQTGKWEYPLSFNALTDSEKTTLQDFFDAKYGSLTAFTFDDPISGSEVTVYFAEDSLQISKETANTWTASCTLVEDK